MNPRRTDQIWKALSDKTRRKILDLLAEAPRTTGQIASAFPKLSRFAVMKHLRVLHRAGLLVITRDGRNRWNSLNPVPLQEVLSRWIGRQEQMWASALLGIRDSAESNAPPNKGDSS